MQNSELRKAGLKVTVPRVKILKILEKAGHKHLSAEAIYRALLATDEDIVLATVYRVLTQFEAAGLVIRRNFEGGRSVFELDCGEHHDHLVCVKCSRVEEFVDEMIEAQQRRIAEKAGFHMTDHELNIYGVCSECQ